jgi:YidC/Oxa1 family membrane protein insertase
MNYMLIFMGFMFYKVPAGLCVYFICSTLWGMGERKLIDLLPQKPIDMTKASEPPKEGFFQKMMRQAHEAADMQQQLQREQEKRKLDNGDDGKGRKGGK